MRNRLARRHGFSLVELLLVITLIAILAAVSMTAFGPVTQSTLITQHGGILAGELQAARMEALASNRPVAVRFYEVPGPFAALDGNQYRAAEFLRLRDDGEWERFRRLYRLPESLAFNPNFSTLIDSGTTGVDADSEPLNEYGGNSYPYVGFQFRPDGSTSLDPNTDYYVTLVEQRLAAESEAPPNFASIQIDPLSGSVRVHRPR